MYGFGESKRRPSVTWRPVPPHSHPRPVKRLRQARLSRSSPPHSLLIHHLSVAAGSPFPVITSSFPPHPPLERYGRLGHPSYYLLIPSSLPLERCGRLGYPGQVVGGRWKPLHYWFRNFLFTDLFVACRPSNLSSKGREAAISGRRGDGGGSSGYLCAVSNDSPWPFDGRFTLTALDLLGGNETVLRASNLSIPEGAGARRYVFVESPTLFKPTRTMLTATLFTRDGSIAVRNDIPLVPPMLMKLPPTNLSVEVHKSSQVKSSQVTYQRVCGDAWA